MSIEAKRVEAFYAVLNRRITPSEYIDLIREIELINLNNKGK